MNTIPTGADTSAIWFFEIPGDTCGDGFRDLDEECDAGAGNSNTRPDACRTEVVVDGTTRRCVAALCGDGVIDSGELCDDGNSIDTDACPNDCILSTCGNGVVDSGEECDDGGESATCDGDCTSAVCGDNVVNGTAGEECDDGTPEPSDPTDGCEECKFTII